MTPRKYVLGMAVLVLLAFSVQAYSQTASISGIVTDESGGVLPGADVTVTNTATGVTQKVVTNATGAYSVPGLQVGLYKVTAEFTGFQTQTKTDIKLGAVAQLRVNFELAVAARAETVEVSVERENVLLESSSSVGVMLPEEKLNELPVVGSNVLDLMKVMGGVNMTDSPTFGADRTTFAGVSAANVNLQRDGITVNDVRWATGASSPVFLNPELVNEFKLVIAPVDAEMGRGTGQVQVVTRSGANDYHGSAVWHIQNTALDANQWSQNRSGVQTNWRNQEEYTLSVGGPLIKNKTFFFVSWDHQISRIREHNVNVQVPTPCARKGIYRYFDGYTNGNYLTNPSTGFGRSFANTASSVYANGQPRIGELPLPAYMGGEPGAISQLRAYSVFGPLRQEIPANDFNCDSVAIDPSTGMPTADWVDYGDAWDPLRTPDTSGYVQRFMAMVPSPNNYDIGDGLNWAGYRWVRTNDGIDNVYGLGEGPNRKQFSFRFDHNFNSSHRVSVSSSWETNHGEDAQPQWPENSYGGLITRDPMSIAVNLTSTLRPTLLNEFRFGLSRTESYVVSPLHNDLNGSSDKLKSLLKELYPPELIPNYNPDIPLLIGLGTQFQISGGSHPYGSGRGNFGTYWGGHDPRYVFADTMTWTKGRHSFKFGGEVHLTQSYQKVNGSVSFTSSNITSPYVITGASANFPNTGLYRAAENWWETPQYTLPGLTGSASSGVVSGMYNMLNMYSGSVGSVGQYYYVNTPDALTYNDVTKGENLRITDYRQNQFNMFFKDDWKVTNDLTLNLGVRYEWYGVPYLANGMTTGLKGGALSIFGRSGRSFADWMRVRPFTPGEPIEYKGEDAEIAFIGPDSPNPDQQLYNDDWNNFGPAIGFAWQLPWLGKGKTTIRGGYQVNFVGLGRADAAIVYPPGIARDYTDSGAAWTEYVNLANLGSVLPVRVPTYMKTPAADPVIPVDQRQQSISVFDPNLRTPYIQNLTFSITRNIGSDLTVDVRYIGTLSRKQTGTINLNSANFMKNGLKEVFDAARRGEDPPELDRMFNGISLVRGAPPVGQRDFQGVLQTGAMHMRGASEISPGLFQPSMQQLLANGRYSELAAMLATLNVNTSFNKGEGAPPAPEAYTAGQVLRLNGYPENFIYTSPQFSAANWTGNLNHANYHSLQAQVTMRPKFGLSLSGTYTWSRNLGMLTPQDPMNRDADYGLLNSHRSHAFTSYGTYDLPFGPGRQLFSGVNPRIVGRIIGGWQLSWIHTMQTGRPAAYTAVNSLWGSGLPDLVGPFNNKSGAVKWEPGADTGTYFNNLFELVEDPQCAGVTTLQGLRDQCTLVAAKRVDTEQIIFQNPLPGTRGNYHPGQITTPLTWNTDMSLTKSINIQEDKRLTLRIDATNVFNHAQPNRGTFGSSGSRVVAPGDFSGNITMMSIGPASVFSPNYAPGYLDAKVGARTFQGTVRIDF